MPKKYSLNVEGGEVVSVEVDGVRYERPDQIPDPEDRAKIELLMSRPPSESFDDAFDKQFEADLRELEKESASFPKVIVAIFLGISILMLAIAAVSAFNTARTLSRQRSAPGRVLELVVRRDQTGREFFYPVVEFGLPDGSRQTVQMSEGSWPAPYDPGEAVTVLYDAAQPRNAHIRSSGGTLLPWILTLITGVLGLAFLGASLFVRWFTKKEVEAAAQPTV